jgi:hypothetical protein
MGFLMMAGFSIAAWDFAHGIVNHTVLLGVVALFLGVIRAGEAYGIDAIVDEQPIVKKTPALRYVLGYRDAHIAGPSHPPVANWPAATPAGSFLAHGPMRPAATPAGSFPTHQREDAPAPTTPGVNPRASDGVERRERAGPLGDAGGHLAADDQDR